MTIRFLLLAVSLLYAIFLDVGVDAAPEYRISPRLVGGNLVDASRSLHTVGLRLYDANSTLVKKCGGARFSKYWFITAAECLDLKKYQGIEVIVPAEYPVLWPQILRKALVDLYFVLHPEYNASTKENNIGVLRLSPKKAILPGDTFVEDPTRFISLPRRSDQLNTFFNEPVTMSTFIDIEKPKKYFKEMALNILRTKVEMTANCKKQYPTNVVQAFHICAMNYGGKRLTEDDVGIPLVLEKKDNPVLIGLGSNVVTPDGSNAPMVFLRITPYLEWIHRTTFVELLD